ncbi:MAG: transketolase [Acidobacteriales bacterium]|nr:transketolase [Terriglobales bacterium]
MNNLDQLCINTLRFLAVDAVEQAKSGHPGLPLGVAPMAYAIFDRHLRFNPEDPNWFNRDRFILSPGHGSALLYALLHMYGYALPLDEVRNFRQWGSKTPGHPEYGHTPGVEATTGPLGQGFAMGVGMAMAERYLAADFNPVFDASLVDHFTYAIVSDGDLMEGIASEAASLAGTLKLGKLIYLYDDNEISIEGRTDLSFTENVAMRFEAYDWHVLTVEDGNDVDAISAAIDQAKLEDRPSLIVVQTHIGFGSPKQDTAGAHGEPLGAEAMAATRAKLGWPAETFHVPAEAAAHMKEAGARGAKLQGEWQSLLQKAEAKNADAAARLQKQIKGELPKNWDANVPEFSAEKADATRNASGLVLNALARSLGNMIGGSADLAPSNKSNLKDCGEYGTDCICCGPNIHFGVRELAMAAIVNGLALHGGLIPYGATFLVFSDYARPAMRLSALMQCHSIFIYTHDSIGVGEDGPTHQPVEHLWAARLIPGFTVYRPGDANETAECWKLAISRREPCLLALTRQNLVTLDLARYPVKDGVKRGGYILSEAQGEPQLVLLATGSEVELAIKAQEELAKQNIAARVVSMPAVELFDKQDEAYRCSVLPCAVPTLAIEAGSTMGWYKYVGSKGAVIGLDHFGASAPAKTVFANFGFTVENVVEKAKALLS